MMYLVLSVVLSAFTSSPYSLLATTKTFAFFFIICTLPPNMYRHHQHKPEAGVYHLISVCPGLPEPSPWCTLKQS